MFANLRPLYTLYNNSSFIMFANFSSISVYLQLYLYTNPYNVVLFQITSFFESHGQSSINSIIQSSYFSISADVHYINSTFHISFMMLHSFIQCLYSATHIYLICLFRSYLIYLSVLVFTHIYFSIYF